MSNTKEYQLTPEEQELVDLHRSGSRFISWNTLDFEARATVLESINHEGKTYYEREKFGIALENMIYKHDAGFGINWDTIDYYLDTYCS